MYINNMSWQSVAQMSAYRNSASFSPSHEESAKKTVETKSSAPASLDLFSEKAVLIFSHLTSGFSSAEKEAARESLSSIGRAAAFASANGFESQNDLALVSQYFNNFNGVLSDDAIKKMIHAKLDNPDHENRVFLERFAAALDEPLRSIDIKV